MPNELGLSVGQTLRRVRAGAARLTSNAATIAAIPQTIRVGSSAFGDGQAIPRRFTADGEAISPPLSWDEVPDGVRGFALLVEDADFPGPSPLVHALVVGLPDWTRYLEPGAIPHRRRGGSDGAGLVVGRSGFGRAGWIPPAPPPGHGPHRYAFQIFALAAIPRFDWPPGRRYALRALAPHVLARGMLFGTYERF